MTRANTGENLPRLGEIALVAENDGEVDLGDGKRRSEGDHRGGISRHHGSKPPPGRGPAGIRDSGFENHQTRIFGETFARRADVDRSGAVVPEER